MSNKSLYIRFGPSCLKRLSYLFSKRILGDGASEGMLEALGILESYESFELDSRIHLQGVDVSFISEGFLDWCRFSYRYS